MAQSKEKKHQKTSQNPAYFPRRSMTMKVESFDERNHHALRIATYCRRFSHCLTFSFFFSLVPHTLYEAVCPSVRMFALQVNTIFGPYLIHPKEDEGSRKGKPCFPCSPKHHAMKNSKSNKEPEREREGVREFSFRPVRFANDYVQPSATDRFISEIDVIGLCCPSRRFPLCVSCFPSSPRTTILCPFFHARNTHTHTFI